MIARPAYCRLESYAMFAEAVKDLERPGALLHGATAIAMHEMKDVDLPMVEEGLEKLAARVRGRTASRDSRALVTHAHEVLFEEEGYTGNTEDYYNPRNSYLPAVLETKRGIPITLTLVYKEVLGRLGVNVEGINAPDHFLAGVQMDGSLMLVDAFFGGRVISRNEVFERIEQVRGTTIARSDVMLRAATNAQWLGRMLANLQNIFARTGREADVRAMTELGKMLGSGE